MNDCPGLLGLWLLIIHAQLATSGSHRTVIWGKFRHCDTVLEEPSFPAFTPLQFLPVKSLPTPDLLLPCGSKPGGKVRSKHISYDLWKEAAARCLLRWMNNYPSVWMVHRGDLRDPPGLAVLESS